MQRKKHFQRRLAMSRLIIATILAVFLMGGAWDTPYAGEPSFKGVTLRIGLPTGYTDALAMKEGAIEAAKRLGIEMEFLTFTVDQLHNKLLLDFHAKNPAWDIVFASSAAASEYMRLGLITPLSVFMKENPSLVDGKAMGREDLYRPEDFTFDGQWAGIPIYATGVAMFWRSDLFSHPGEKAAFQKRYGYALNPPATYEQFRDVAEFFTRKKGDQLMGKQLEGDFYGTVHSNKPPLFLWYDFVNYLVAFGGNDIYDPATMRPTMNSPATIEAVKYYIDLGRFQPPGHLNMSSGEATSLFAAGHVAMQIEYLVRATEIAMHPTKSKVANLIDFTVLPSKKGVPGRPSAAHAGGNAMSIYSLSKNKPAAYKLLELILTPEIQKKVLLEKFAAGGWVPVRYSVMKNPEVQERIPWMKRVNDDLMRKDIYYFQLAQIPEYSAAIDIAAAQIHKAMAGQLTAEAAMAQAQTELEGLFKRAGYIK
jgi:multiple sugar transport system substrate-binding protein